MPSQEDTDIQAMASKLASSPRNGSERPPVPLDSQAQAKLDRELQVQSRLEIKALIHDAWLRQIQQRRGILFRITPPDIRVLELIFQALDNIKSDNSGDDGFADRE